MVNVQLPDGASLERTDRALAQVSEIAKATPGVENVITISGISVLDNNATLPSAGVAYVMLNDWSVREKAKGQDMLSLFRTLTAKLNAQVLEAATTVIPPPPIQGIGNAGGFTMIDPGQGRQRRFQQAAERHQHRSSPMRRRSRCCRRCSPRSARRRRRSISTVDRNKAEKLGVTVGQVFSALEDYVGSSYVTQFNKFGQVFQVYVQAESRFRMRPKTCSTSRSGRRRARWCRSEPWSRSRQYAGSLAHQPLQSLSGRDDLRPASARLQLRPGHGI